MGISLQTYKTQALKRLITETLYEVLDSEAFKTSFNLTLSDEGYTTEIFEDGEGNLIRVIFHSLGKEMYELDFTLNGSSFSNPDINYTIKQYSSLLYTVANAVSQFLQEIKPKGLKIDGEDSFAKILKRINPKSQKNLIYDYFLSKIRNDTGYKIERLEGGNFNLIRK
jgi:hypothetical protein